ncbi:alpha/beta hydrolase family protein [Hymenobacter nivis]|uniref:Alpha/beta hydrolase n=1 Tax=Hymenobacter nivis TaxID=1850093 RepID=A0A502GQE6_9BACT|nr:alpha/beta hydrolase [Hymenobacter nivis]TPG63658.1 alpha/beta hydrolase [Hymenobacter nivis]
MHDYVGYCAVNVEDKSLNLSFPLAVLYPSSTPGRPERLGPYELNVALGAPPKAGAWPLVLLSHGGGSTPLVYRTLAHALARRGFVVGLPEHPFNHLGNNAWEYTAQNLVARPHHLRLAADALLHHPPFAAVLKPNAVALIGHSMGGYAALAAAGGAPMTGPRESPAGAPEPVATVADGRVRALVLLAPATAWFSHPGALRRVHAPILLLTAEHDAHTPPVYAQLVRDGVPNPARLTHRVVANAGHFSFLSPFPAARISPDFPPSQDPPGFDRARFHDALPAEIAAFLALHV